MHTLGAKGVSSKAKGEVRGEGLVSFLHHLDRDVVHIDAVHGIVGFMVRIRVHTCCRL